MRRSQASETRIYEIRRPSFFKPSVAVVSNASKRRSYWSHDEDRHMQHMGLFSDKESAEISGTSAMLELRREWDKRHHKGKYEKVKV
jgi:hypothetical protein